MSDAYSLFSSADISREEYAEFLREMNATDITMMTNHVYDASIVENTGSFYISLDKGEDIEKNALIEFKDDKRRELFTLLGGEPKTLMSLDVSTFFHESSRLAVKFAAMIADHYPCVVLSHTSNTYYTSERLIDLRNKGLGFDGFDWQRLEKNRHVRELEDVLEDVQEVQENAHKEVEEG